ncbi:MAG: DUF1244 domain-containing protein [Pseudomonadota bacterium]
MVKPEQLDPKTQQQLEASVFRRLVGLLQHRTDVQNIDLMGVGGFCRNCLADWYKEAAEEAGIDIDKETARSHIYGMPYDTFKARHQTEASQAQLEKMQESVERNPK